MAILGAKDQSSVLPKFIFQQSITWTCPVAMEAIVYVIGAGGSGGHVGHSQVSSNYNCNSGGAGGCAISRLSLVAQDYTVTIGSGGERSDGTNNHDAGNAGGNTVFSGSGIDTMTGNGGGAGKASFSSVTAVAGGSASGGNISNNTGGGSLACSTDYVSSGGGGVNFGGSAANCDGGPENTYSAGGSMLGSAPTLGHAGTTSYTRQIGNYEGRNAVLSYDIFGLGINHALPPDPTYDAASSSRIYNRGGHRSMMGDRHRFMATYSSSGGYVRMVPAPPFQGGMSLMYNSGTSTTSYGQPGGIGSGGGSNMNGSNSTTTYSGAGGRGVVMVFPITMG